MEDRSPLQTACVMNSEHQEREYAPVSLAIKRFVAGPLKFDQDQTDINIYWTVHAYSK